ncbi:hypothetical protein V6U90_24815 [Micromonospora sp. CPCC 206060]|uniref:hypothetical protein n=1 Tax=Micromonospora sp. CPCC 206060 TaxID=3122406 RepID=UPI002FEEE0D9
MSEVTVRLCPDENAFLRWADQWTPGQPFPLLTGPEVQRYQALFGKAGLPAVPGEVRAGVVVSTGDTVSRAAGHLLASATRRDHLHVAPADVLAELGRRVGEFVALVGAADDLYGLGEWPGATGARVGLVVARTPSALICLVYRSLTAHAVGDDRVFVVSHPLIPGAETADATSLAELEPVRRRRVKLLTLHAWGRECSSSLLDSVICGRSDPLNVAPVEVAPGQRRTSCLRGEGCFRTDIPEDARVPATEMNATLVFTHSCRSADAGTNVFPTRISLTLGLLEGTAVAVIGVLGMHQEQGSEQWTLEAALADQVPLGEVVHRLSTRSFPLQGELTRFGLFGDPGQILRWRPDFPGSVTTRPRMDEQAVATLRHLQSVVLPRLEHLRWFSYQPLDEAGLSAVRQEIRRLAVNLLDPAFARDTQAVAEQVADLQHHAVHRMTEHIYSHGWEFMDHGLPGLREVATEPRTCPHCRRDIAVRVSMRHYVDDSLHVQTVQCRRCGDIWWSTEVGHPSLHMRGAVEFDMSRAQPGHIEREVINGSGRVVRGAVGFGFSNRKIFGLPPGQVAACTLGSGESRLFRFRIDATDHRALAEMHTTVFVALLDGIHIASVGMMRLE